MIWEEEAKFLELSPPTHPILFSFLLKKLGNFRNLELYDGHFFENFPKFSKILKFFLLFQNRNKLLYLNSN